MPGAEGFQYAILRVVPRVERGECMNVGVVLYCRRLRFLAARVALDPERLRALDASCDPAAVQAALDAIVAVAAASGDGPLSRLDPSDRFGWIAAPSSTVVQPSPVHTGLTTDPAADLDRLFAKLVT